MFGAIVSAICGNIPATTANICAIVWVIIARIRESACIYYTNMYHSILDAYKDVEKECDKLQHKVEDLMKDKANDNFSGEN